MKKFMHKFLGKLGRRVEKRRRRKYGPRLGKGYTGVGQGRLFADWNTSQTSANTEIETALSALRNNARDLYQNNDYVRRFSNLMKTNIIGHSGIMLKSKVFTPSGEPDTQANQKIETGWKFFSKLGETTVCGRYSMVDALKQIVHSVAIDGEILIRFIQYQNSPFNFSLQIIEADHLDEKLNKVLDNGNQIKMGVEVDSFNRAVAHWLTRFHPGDERNGTLGKNRYERVPADEILHIFMPERPNQVRGVTWIAAPEARLKMLDGFEDATLVGQRVAASTMGVIHNNDGQLWEGDNPPNDDDETTEAQDGDVVFEAEAGVFKQLVGDKTIEKWDPSPPGTNYADFVKAVLRGVSSGLNIAYENLANDRSDASYSSIRQGEITDRDSYRVVQKFIIEHFCQLVFEDWLDSALLTGAVKLPLFKFEQFNAATWRPRGWLWVDPDKESKAAERDIANQIESAEDLAARRGSDIFENINENEVVNNTAEEAGLKMPAFNSVEGVENEQTSQEI